MTWFGRPADQILDRAVRDVVGQEVYEARLPFLARALAGEEITFDATMPYHGGPARESEIRYVPRRAADGAVDGIFVLVTDIAERARARADLQEAEDRLRLALEGSGTGVYDYDLVSGVLTWDGRTRALFGLTGEDPVSYEETFLPGVHPDDRERTDRTVKAAIGSPEGFDIAYRVVGLRDGIERVLAAKGNTVFRDGAPVRFVGTVRDVTQARAAEVQARRLAALVEQSSDFIGIAGLDAEPSTSTRRVAGSWGSGARRRHAAATSSNTSHPSTAMRCWRREVLPTVQETGFWGGDLAFRDFATGAAVPVHSTVFRSARGRVRSPATAPSPAT